MLSGGERNRLLLARLFARPANMLVLDEPTNDLDIESLELLESTLQEYHGTVLLVSHDRRFLDEVVTQTLASEGGGSWKEYAGGYSAWLEQRPAHRLATRSTPVPRMRPPSAAAEPSRPSTAAHKLTFKETRELEQLPARIVSLEQEQQSLTDRMSTADYHARGAEQIRLDRQRLEAIGAELEDAFTRWAELEARAAALKPA
jgi:ATP-binding cassette subfamily F protein uup